MKIAFASDDSRTIAGHFGRARGFLIVELRNKDVVSREYRSNVFTGHARGLNGQHGHNHDDRHGPILDALKDCNIVVSHGMGRRIYEDLIVGGIAPFITNETEIDQALALFNEGRLDNVPHLACDQGHTHE
jgi:predicted Fe-Mo cluster-binding NifX family protein